MSDSIWRSIDTAEKSDYGKMECMEMTDVAIVGGGLCGILCAWFLKDAGWNARYSGRSYYLHNTYSIL